MDRRRDDITAQRERVELGVEVGGGPKQEVSISMARRSQDKVPFKLCSQPLSFFSSVSNMNNDQEKLRHTAHCHLVISFSLLISPIPTV